MVEDQETMETHMMRIIEWERAKASLRAILHTMWDMDQEQLNELNQKTERFIEYFDERIRID